MIVLDTNKLEKKASRRSEKCFYKELCYDHTKDPGPYTVISILHPGAAYPRHEVREGTLEYFVLKGNFHFNGSDYGPGTFIQIAQGEYSEVSSQEGCEVLVILKGKVDF